MRQETTTQGDDILADGVLTIAELKAWGITRTVAFRMVKNGDLPAIRLGKKLVVAKRAVFNLLKRSMTTAGV